jgi:hypothetical protein
VVAFSPGLVLLSRSAHTSCTPDAINTSFEILHHFHHYIILSHSLATTTILTNMRTGRRFPVLPQTRRNPLSHIDGEHETPPPSYQASALHKPHLDLPQRLEHKLAQYNASENVCKRWIFEILSVTTSAVCMGEAIPRDIYLMDASVLISYRRDCWNPRHLER